MKQGKRKSAVPGQRAHFTKNEHSRNILNKFCSEEGDKIFLFKLCSPKIQQNDEKRQQCFHFFFTEFSSQNKTREPPEHAKKEEGKVMIIILATTVKVKRCYVSHE